MLHLVDAHALLSVQLCFVGSVCVDAAFGEEIGAAAGDDEGGPAVAVGELGLVGVGGWGSTGDCRWRGDVLD